MFVINKRFVLGFDLFCGVFGEQSLKTFDDFNYSGGKVSEVQLYILSYFLSESDSLRPFMETVYQVSIDVRSISNSLIISFYI